MQISKYNWYFLLPVNIFFTLPVYIGSELRDYINLTIANYIYVFYILLLVLLYTIINYKFYTKISNAVFFKYNFINLGISLIICLLFDRFLEHWEWFFYALTSTQHHIVLWSMFMIWQCVVRFFAWIRYS